MKRILSIICVLIISFNSFGQTFPIVPRTNSSYTVQDARFSAGLNLFVPKYADTTAANAGTSEGNDSLGAIIYTYDVQSFWGRQYVSGKRWVALGSGGGGGTGLFPTAGTGIATGNVTGDLNGNDLAINNVTVFTLSSNSNTISGTLTLLDLAGNGAGVVAVDNLGNLSWSAGSGGGSGLFPTTGTGTATGAVIGSLAGNTLNISQGANSFLRIDPTAGAEEAYIRAYNTTGSDNAGRFQASTTNTTAQSLFEATFNGGAKEATIQATANTTSATLEYEADTHTFIGTMILDDLAGNGVGYAAVSNTGVISWSAGPNLIVQNPPTSSGIQTWYDSNDTLYLKRVTGSAFISTTTLTDSTLSIKLDTASAGLKSYIALYGTAGTSETASNGLQKVGSDIQLGGTALSGNTSVLTSAFSMTFNSSTSSGGTLLGVNTADAPAISGTGNTGYGVYGISTSSYGGGFYSTNSIGLLAGVIPASTNTVLPVLEVNRWTTGTAANGIGASIDLKVETTDATAYMSNQIISTFTNATTATRTSQLNITGVNSATTETYANFQTGGVVRVNNLADTLSTKAYARSVGGAGASTFVALTDGPGAFTGQAGKAIRVNVGETALEYFSAAGSGTVTDFIYTDGNGFNGTVTSSTTTPTLSIAMTFTGWAYSNGTSLAAGTISTGLTNTTGTLTANLSVGVSGGQSAIGGTASGDDLTLSSTSHATKGYIQMGNSIYDEVNNRLGISGVPSDKLDVWGTASNMLVVGGELSAATRTNSTTKYGGNLSLPHYTLSEEPFNLIRGSSGSGSNIVVIGNGVASAANSATSIEMYTAANNTTTAGTRRFNLTNTETTFNDGLANHNFIVSGDVDASTFVVDANGLTNGAVGIGTAAPTSKFHVAGSVAFNLTATATGITADATHYTIVVTATGQTITLPTAVGCTGRIYTIKLSASGSGTVATTSSQTIDGSTTYSLSAQYKYVMVQSDNANWHIIANN